MVPLNIVAIVKDEGFYLEEWIEYHILQGVSNFFIFNNGSTDDTQEILDRYEELEIVTSWGQWTGKQQEAYQEFLNNVKAFNIEDEWCAFIDADEFIYNANGTMTVQERLEKFKGFSGVVLHWMLFGSGGFKKRDKGKLVTERFLLRDDKYNQHTKTILKPSAINMVGKNPHYFIFKPEAIVVDATGKAIPHTNEGLLVPNKACTLRINHYHTKSYEEYITKCDRGDANGGTPKEVVKDFPAHDLNKREDRGMLNFTNQIKKAIASRPWNTR